jgi:hypothetical protein
MGADFIVLRSARPFIRRLFMRKPFAFACFSVLLVGVLISCKATDKTPEAATSSALSNAAKAVQEEKPQYQYMAVCMTKEEHGDNEYILTRWLDSKDRAEIYGGEHVMKRKGHEVIYKERAKPQSSGN